MAAKQSIPKLDVEKLRDNALTSIRLGVEDFDRCQTKGDEVDPARALSSIRNLFAGVLLLFKYKIAICVDDSEDAADLIFNPPEVLPHSDGDGGIEWMPVGNFKRSTIDVATIKKRFTAFGISVDWGLVSKLQDCRNHLEHLHPANTLGEVADFVAELFPLLRDFIQKELEQQPAEILGATWSTMLEHHNFLKDNRHRCNELWAQAGVPSGMEQWIDSCKCSECGSTLLTPSQDSLDEEERVGYDDDSFKSTCVACGNTELIAPLMMDELNKAYDYNPRDGEESKLEDCYECGRSTFHIFNQQCLWCEAGLAHTKCWLCDELLSQDDQDNGGLCSYHAYKRDKYMRED